MTRPVDRERYERFGIQSPSRAEMRKVRLLAQLQQPRRAEPGIEQRRVAMADYGKDDPKVRGAEIASASTASTVIRRNDETKAALRSFDPYSPVRDGFAGFIDDAALVDEWSNTSGEEFMQAAHNLTVAELQHGIHVAEGVARRHAVHAERAAQVAENLREVASRVARVGKSEEAMTATERGRDF